MIDVDFPSSNQPAKQACVGKNMSLVLLRLDEKVQGVSLSAAMDERVRVQGNRLQP